MNFLLDTHIWLWMLNEPDRIGQHLARVLKDSADKIWISPINTWEVLVLARKGRIQLDRSAGDWIAAATAPFREAPLTHEIALLADTLSLPHRDPADRFLVATAKVLGLTLCTADTKMLGLGDIATLANR